MDTDLGFVTHYEIISCMDIIFERILLNVTVNLKVSQFFYHLYFSILTQKWLKIFKDFKAEQIPPVPFCGLRPHDARLDVMDDQSFYSMS